MSDKKTQRDKMDSAPKHFPFYGKQFHRHICVCKSTKCKELVGAFQAKGDQRGSFFCVLTPKSGSRQDTYAQMLDRKRERMAKHFNLPLSKVNAFDGRDRSKSAPSQTRSMTEEITTQKNYVAVHHFNPLIIDTIFHDRERQQYRWAHTVPKSYVQDMMLKHPFFGTYTSANECDSDNYFIVPSYKNAESNLMELESYLTTVATIEEVQMESDKVSRRSSQKDDTSAKSQLE